MIRLYSGTTADEAWGCAFEDFANGSWSSRVDSRSGPTHEVLNAWFTILDPTKRWVLSRLPAMNPAFALVEVVWILSGRDDSMFINHWNPQYPKYAGHVPHYHGAYGHRLRKSLGFDQLDRAFDALRKNAASRQVVLQIWNAVTDMPAADGASAAEDIPCNICSLLKMRDDKLEWTQILRSNDLYLGVPHNFVQFTMLQEIIAGWLGVGVGSYHQLSHSLHVYDRDADTVSRDRSNSLPSSSEAGFALTRAAFDDVLEIVQGRLDQLLQPSLSPDDISAIVRVDAVPTAYADLLLVAGADDARRRGYVEAANKLVEDCNSRILRQLWSAWAARRRLRTKEPVERR